MKIIALTMCALLMCQVCAFAAEFDDVTEDRYFYNPVLWALEKEITVGTSPTTFGTDDKCTRGQIVTFLYRNFE